MWINLRRSLVALLALTLVAVSAEAAQVQDEQKGPRLVLAGQMELGRLVDLAAERLQVTVEYDPTVLRGTVTLRAEGDLNDQELWSLMNHVLASRGFTTVRLPGRSSFSIVRLSDAGAVAPIRSDASAPHGIAPGFVVTVARAHHRPAKDLAEALAKVVSKAGGSATAIGEGGLVMISDLETRVAHALEVLRLLDVPAAPATIEEVALKHLNAQQVTTLITQLAARREQATGDKVAGDVLPSPAGTSVFIVSKEHQAAFWRGLVSAVDQREGAATVIYSSRAFGVQEVADLIERSVRDPRVPDDRWRLVVDELTGTLIITATATQHDAIEALLARLDAAPESGRRPMRTYIIRNRGVEEVVQILENLIQAGVLEADTPDAVADVRRASQQLTERPLPTAISQATGAAGRRDDEPAAPAQRKHRRLEPGNDSLVLTADKGTNTLIAVGEPRLLSQIETLLVTLDVRQPQVMLEVLLLSLSENQAFDLGVELEHLRISGDVRIRLSSLFGLSTRTDDTRSVGDGPGFTGVVLSPGDFAVVLRALQTINRGRSLSMPQLLVANNEAAVLDSVLQQPFATVQATPTLGTTTGFGGTQDAGTTVTIEPQIAEGDHLILKYSVALSAFIGNASVEGLPPPRQQNRIQSVATIPDGYTIVVGGIELSSESRAITQVPILGSIPIIGEVFKSRANSSNRSRFYIFIRANILRGRGFEDLKYISDASVAATDGAIDDGWPVVEPRIIR